MVTNQILARTRRSNSNFTAALTQKGKSLESLGIDNPKTEIQSQALLSIAGGIAAGQLRGYVEIPSRVGKTRLMTHVAVTAAKQHKRTLIIAPLRENIIKTLSEIEEADPSVSKHWIQSDGSQSKSIELATYAGFAQQIKDGRIKIENYDLILRDESHEGLTDLRAQALEEYAGILIDFSATPSSGGIKTVDRLTPKPYFELSLINAIERRAVSDFKSYLVHTGIDLTGVARLGDFYQDSSLDKFLLQHDVHEIALEAYKSIIPGRTAIGYCSSIAQCKAAAAFFRKNGIKADFIEGSDTERAEKIQKLSTGEIKVLFSATLLTRAIDIPSLAGVLCLVPTRSFIRAKQRGMRPLTLDPDNFEKMAAIIELVYFDSRVGMQNLTFPEVSGVISSEKGKIQWLDRGNRASQTKNDSRITYSRTDPLETKIISDPQEITDYVQAVSQHRDSISNQRKLTKQMMPVLRAVKESLGISFEDLSEMTRTQFNSIAASKLWLIKDQAKAHGIDLTVPSLRSYLEKKSTFINFQNCHLYPDLRFKETPELHVCIQIAENYLRKGITRVAGGIDGASLVVLLAVLAKGEHLDAARAALSKGFWPHCQRYLLDFGIYRDLTKNEKNTLLEDICSEMTLLALSSEKVNFTTALEKIHKVVFDFYQTQSTQGLPLQSDNLNLPPLARLSDEEIDSTTYPGLVEILNRNRPSMGMDIIHAYYIEELSHQQIADRFDLPLDLVKHIRARTLKRLEQQIRQNAAIYNGDVGTYIALGQPNISEEQYHLRIRAEQFIQHVITNQITDIYPSFLIFAHQSGHDKEKFGKAAISVCNDFKSMPSKAKEVLDFFKNRLSSEKYEVVYRELKDLDYLSIVHKLFDQNPDLYLELSNYMYTLERAPRQVRPKLVFPANIVIKENQQIYIVGTIATKISNILKTLSQVNLKTLTYGYYDEDEDED